MDAETNTSLEIEVNINQNPKETDRGIREV